MIPGGTAHGLQHGWSNLQVCVTIPWWCVEVRLLDTEVFHCPSVSPYSANAGVLWEGRVFALPSWACAQSVPGTGVVISWEHGIHALSV